MSTTSTATTLAARDWIPSDEMDLLNCTCILVVTRGDGTAFDATSMQDEDKIEFYIQLGCKHPKGVLR